MCAKTSRPGGLHDRDGGGMRENANHQCARAHRSRRNATCWGVVLCTSPSRIVTYWGRTPDMYSSIASCLLARCLPAHAHTRALGHLTPRARFPAYVHLGRSTYHLVGLACPSGHAEWCTGQMYPHMEGVVGGKRASVVCRVLWGWTLPDCER